MIAYQVPVVMRHLTPLQIIDEGVESFTAVGIFAFIASVGIPVDPDMLDGLSQTESPSDIHDALVDLEQHKLIEPVHIATDINLLAKELAGKLEEVTP